jgi:protein involved in plasmid replication-relaxation
MEAVAAERRKLFERPAQPRECRITARDLALLEHIARLRLASSAQLAALDGGSEQNVSRALLALFENSYVERPVAQVAARRLNEGSRPMIYGLTRKGAALLRRNGHDVRRRLLDGIDKNRGAGWRFVEHTVAVSEFMVALELAVRERKDVRIVERGEILEATPKSKQERRVRMETTVRLGSVLRKNAVVPDALFGLRFNDEEESYFMVEVDRGEMPIERYKNLYQTYFAKKMLTYYEANRQKRHVHDLGIENFRVLTLTTDAHRVELMLVALSKITEGRGTNMFLFADQSQLVGSNPLEIDWVSGRGGKVRITD